jgi:hypothetical protein
MIMDDDERLMMKGDASDCDQYTAKCYSTLQFTFSLTSSTGEKDILGDIISRHASND